MIAGARPDASLDALFINAPLKDYDHAPRYNDFTLPVLGLGYIATYAQTQGFNVGVLDAEAPGLGISQVVALVHRAQPRWVGLNLLAPTYRYSVEILQRLDPAIAVMLGGHQAKALPERILRDQRIPRTDALLLGVGKRITPEMTKKAVLALTRRGINVKGYFILGFPTETHAEAQETLQLIYDFWDMTDGQPGTFRCSAFEFRPYPGTPQWHRLLATGRFQEDALLRYESVDLTNQGHVRAMLERDECNFSVNLQSGDVPVETIRTYLTRITVEQKQRLSSGPDHVQRAYPGLRL
jgi:hypothetical protein